MKAVKFLLGPSQFLAEALPPPSLPSFLSLPGMSRGEFCSSSNIILFSSHQPYDGGAFLRPMFKMKRLCSERFDHLLKATRRVRGGLSAEPSPPTGMPMPTCGPAFPCSLPTFRSRKPSVLTPSLVSLQSWFRVGTAPSQEVWDGEDYAMFCW